MTGQTAARTQAVLPAVQLVVCAAYLGWFIRLTVDREAPGAFSDSLVYGFAALFVVLLLGAWHASHKGRSDGRSELPVASVATALTTILATCSLLVAVAAAYGDYLFT